MTDALPTIYDWIFLAICFVLTLMFLFQAYYNLVRSKLSRFSFDALSLVLAKLVSNSKSRKRVQELSRDPKRIRTFGIFGILGVIGGVYQIIQWFAKYYPK